MKAITEQLLYDLRMVHSVLNHKRIKWSDIFDTEEELIEAMFNHKVYTDEDRVPMYMWCKGYEYIKGFRRYYRLHGYLTKGQMTQLKRLASEIVYRIYCC